MAVEGINHVTLSTSDLEASVAFYTELLGCRVLARWPAGAYLLAGDLWLALVAGVDEARGDDDDSHLALHASPEALAAIERRARAGEAVIWQESWTEGASVYLLDPAGHRLEVHATTLVDRLRHAVAHPWEGLELTPSVDELLRGAEGGAAG